MTKTRSADQLAANATSPNTAPCNPPQLLILPENADPAARVITLANPRNTTPSRYFFCPNKGLYEFTKVAAPKAAPRSLLLTRTSNDGMISRPSETKYTNGTRTSTIVASQDVDPLPALQETGSSIESCRTPSSVDISAGYSMQDANLLIATPYDPLFLFLPVLRHQPTPAETAKGQSTSQLLHPASEFFDRLVSHSPHIAFALSYPATSSHFESRLASVCDNVEAGDEKMYRLNEVKLLRELLRKARRVVESGKNKKVELPGSMESKFISRALEVPVANVARESEAANEEIEGRDSTNEELHNKGESQVSIKSQANTQQPPDSAELKLGTGPKPDADIMTHLLRLHTTLLFIIETYLPPRISSDLVSLLKEPLETSSPENPDPSLDVDFSPLHSHLSHISDLRAKAVASRSRDDFARKRSAGEGEEEYLAREEKRRKKDELEEEEKRKKAGQTRAMRDLKKVNVTGMKKMSDFFGKKQGVVASNGIHVKSGIKGGGN